jgi:hypothetical protein
MDKQLLKSLDNLSEALQQISDALSSKEGAKSETGAALQSGDFGSQLKEISVSISSIKADTTEILKGQKTILEMSKSKESDKKTEGIESDPKKEGSIKKGVASILLIAVAVLAIGMAFKLVGKIDFISVVGLGIAIVLVAVAFEKVAKTGMTPSQALNSSLVMVILSGAVLVSSLLLSQVKSLSLTQIISIGAIAVLFHFMAPVISNLIKSITTKQKIKGADGKIIETEGIEWGTLIKSIVMVPFIMAGISLGILVSSVILGKVQPISIQQGITAILISAVFAVAAGGVVRILGVFDREKISLANALKSAIALPFIMAGIAAGIWLSSYVLSKVQPISFTQAITSILIAGVFAVAAYGIGQMLKGLKDIDPATAATAAIMIPILLPAMSAAIAASSWLLSKVVPISFGQFITALGISILFTVLSFGIAKIASAVGQMEWSSVAKIPVFFTLISLALAASAFIFSESKEYFNSIDWMTMLKIIVLGIGMGIVAVVFSFVVKIMGKMEWGTVIKIPIFLTLISLALAASAFILYKAKEYIDGMTFMTLIKLLFFGVVLAITAVVMSIAIWIINKLGTPVDYFKGGISVLIIATTIMVSSLIINEGEYKNYPSWEWILGVGLSILGFGVAMVALGLVALTGVGGAAFLLGIPMILIVAETIVAVSKILTTGNYDVKGLLPWAGAVSLLYAVFVPSMIALGALGLVSGVLEFFGAEDPFEKAKKMMIQIAETIVAVSDKLSKGNFTGGPKKEWAEGVGLAIGAFAPVYGMLMLNGVMKIFGGGGVGPDEFTTAISTVTDGIISAANKFGDPKLKTTWKAAPPKEWAEGVGLAIGAFAPVYSVLLNEKGIFGSGVSVEDMKNAIMTISKGIVDAAGFFNSPENTGVFDITKVPTKQWGEGVGAALGAFAPVFTMMSEKSGWITSGEEVVNNMLYGIVAITVGIIKAGKLFSEAKITWENYPTVTWVEGVKQSLDVYMGIMNSIGSPVSILFKVLSMNSIVTSMINIARKIWINKKFFESKINPNFMSDLSSNIIGFSKIAMYLNAIDKSGGLGGRLDSILGTDPISRTADGMIRLAGAYDKLSDSLQKFGGSLGSIDATKVELVRRLSGNLAVLSAMDSVMFEKMLSTLDSKASVFAKLLEPDLGSGKRPSVGDRDNKKGPDTLSSGKEEKKGKHGTLHEQLDQVIDLLTVINLSTGALDEYLTSKGFVNIAPPAELK